jgi:pyruvate dehydrogenase E2 component (dihydrolipoamide acetyltransferase)
MEEGAVVYWWKAEGDIVVEGDDLVDIETAKINNVFESPASGVLRRIVAQPGETLPVGALIGVLAEPSVGDDEIDAFVTQFQMEFVPEDADGDGPRLLELSTLAVGDMSIRVGRGGTGDGAPVVLIHGYAGDLNGWLFNIEALIADRRVIALDLPGHGGSSKTVGDGSLATLADAVVAVLSALQVSEAHLVGHSLGAAVAARVAIDAPASVRSLTLISPAGLSASAVSEPFLTGIVEAQRAKDLKPVLEMLPADPGLVTREMVDDILKFKRLDGVEEALAILRDRLVDGADAAGLRADLAAIPTALVITSDKDQIVGPIDAADLPAGFRLVMLEGAGHLPHLERASEVNDLLLEATR